MKSTNHCLCALLLLGVLVTTVTFATEHRGGENPVPASKELAITPPLSLLYMNGDPGYPMNSHFNPFIRVKNETDAPIQRNRIKVRYWFTHDRQDILVQQGGGITAFVALTEPREDANWYLEYSLDSGPSYIIPAQGTFGFQFTVLKEDFSPFNEENDYSYMPEGIYQPNEKITVYLDDVLVWGTEPPVVEPTTDVRINYSRILAPATDQLPMTLQVHNFGNTTIDLSSVSLRYWFSDEDTYPFQFIEHYTPIPGVQPNGTFTKLPTPVPGATHYMEVTFDTDFQLPAYSDIRAFKFKIVKGAWEPFINKEDDYSYLAEAGGPWNFHWNEHITVYVDGELVWGTEPVPATPVLSLLHKNIDTAGQDPAANQSIKPAIKLINQTDNDIAYEKIRVRYWFTNDWQHEMNWEVIHAPMGKENVMASFTALPEPHEQANFYLEYAFASGAGVLPARDTTSSWLTSRVRKNNWTDFNELNDYSYLPPAMPALNEHITVYVDDVLVWGTEPPVVPVAEDLRVAYTRGDAPSDTQIPIILRLINNGNIAAPLSELSVRYWFKEEEPSLSFQFIEHYINIPGITTQGSFTHVSPGREGANYYLEITFNTDVILPPFSELRGFKFKILKQGHAPFFKPDDYSYMEETGLFNFLENPHITLYQNGVLKWGVEPPVEETAAGIAGNDADLSLYPTPAMERVTLRSDVPVGDIERLEVYDLSGTSRNVSYTLENNAATLDLHNLQPGVYVIKGIIGQKVYTKRLIVDVH